MRGGASFYEVRAAHSPDTKMWASKESTAWTVILEADPKFQISCLNRFIYVKTVTEVEQALHGGGLDAGETLHCGVWPPAIADAAELARKFARWGVKKDLSVGRDATTSGWAGGTTAVRRWETW